MCTQESVALISAQRLFEAWRLLKEMQHLFFPKHPSKMSVSKKNEVFFINITMDSI